MRLFINDIQLQILRPGKKVDLYAFEKIEKAERINYLEDIAGKTLYLNATVEQVDLLLNVLSLKVFGKMVGVTVMVQDYSAIQELIREKYEFLEASGGLVEKQGKYLLIERLGKWDLPKGKLEKGENPVEGGVREVEEECGVKVIALKKITSTRHTYTLNKKGVLKKTYWYLMECIEDHNMQPQIEEDITQVKWMSPKEATLALKNSYASIGYVFEKYKQKNHKE